METFKTGDIVARKSYNYDLLFRVINVNKDVVDIAGLTVRIIADAPVYDLVHISNEEVNKRIKENENSSKQRFNRSYSSLNRRLNNRNNTKYQNQKVENPAIYKRESIYKKPGIILHIDGDAEYSSKCKESYSKMGLVSYVYNIPEDEQYKHVYNLLQKIHPNVLILTGHDAFLRRRNDIYNINNYKNSKYYIQGVLEARRYEHNLDNLVIFAGACQSYYEAIISAGANFASAPKRVLIDMMDPLIVAQSTAYTPVDQFVPLENIISNTREGIKGIGGIQTRGHLRVRLVHLINRYKLITFYEKIV